MAIAESMKLTADEIIKSRKEREEGEEERLKGFKAFHKELKEGIEELKEVHISLKKGEEERLKGFEIFDKRVKKELKDLKNEVKTMLKEFRTDQKRAASEWARVAETIGTKKEAILPKTKKIEKEERIEVVSVKPKKEEIEGNLLEVLQRKSNGMTLQELSSAMGVHYVTLGSPIKDLMEKGKVKKDEHLYFAVRIREEEPAVMRR